MKVEITEVCTRCKSSNKRELDSSEIPALEEAKQKRADTRDELIKELKKVYDAVPTQTPELVVMFRGTVQTIDQVCDGRCAKTIQTHLTAIFKELDVTKRTPKKKKADTPAAPDEKKDKSGVKGKK